MRAGPYTPKCWLGTIVWWVSRITNVPGLHSDEMPGQPVPGILRITLQWGIRSGAHEIQGCSYFKFVWQQLILEELY
jgi:hypothetical protein